MSGNFMNRLFTGLAIIGVGVLFLLKQTGYISLSIGEIFSTYWPVILIYFGLKQLLSSGSSDSIWGGVPLVIGIIFLGRNLEWMDWSIGEVISYAIPVVIIIAGLRMIWKPRSRHQSPPADEWQSYRPFTDDADVPPAPPLHPDPTQQKTERSEGEENDKQAKQPNYHDGDGPHTFHKKWKEYGKQHRKEQGEWWNYSDDTVQNRSSFIGDIHMGQDYWEVKPMNISHFIGDTVLDLTKAQVPFGETKINISAFIGDVKIYVPNDYEMGVQVVSSAFIGDVKILGQRKEGLFTHVNIQSPMFSEADKKIKLVVSTFIGDVRVTKVG